ncbi:MAG: hypothetical protein ABI353_23495, partial [Isosphaeraceae bacterium]
MGSFCGATQAANGFVLWRDAGRKWVRFVAVIWLPKWQLGSLGAPGLGSLGAPGLGSLGAPGLGSLGNLAAKMAVGFARRAG